MPERARANLVWVWLTVALLAVDFGSIVADSETVDRVMRRMYLVFLAGWYFLQGRSQGSYVRDELRNDYVKKDWKKPLAIAAGAWIFLFLLATAMVMIMDETE